MKAIISIVAAMLTTVSFVPQVIKAFKTKDLKGISIGMYLIFLTGLFLWVVYGVIIKDIAIIVGNIITFLLALTILILKIKYR